jgi:hypothetical protein
MLLEQHCYKSAAGLLKLVCYNAVILSIYYKVVTRNLLTNRWIAGRLQVVGTTYKKSVELNNLVASCQQAVDSLSTSWELVNKLDKLLEQHCYKSAAGLLQLVRFYACSWSCVVNKMDDPLERWVVFSINFVVLYPSSRRFFATKRDGGQHRTLACQRQHLWLIRETEAILQEIYCSPKRIYWENNKVYMETILTVTVYIFKYTAWIILSVLN